MIMAALFAVAIGSYVVALAAPPALRGMTTVTPDSASPRPQPK